MHGPYVRSFNGIHSVHLLAEKVILLQLQLLYGKLVKSKAQTPLIRLVVDLLYNKQYNNSTANPQQVHNKSN